MPRGRRAPTIGRLVPPAPSQADFHAHTARSDGLLAPAELLAAAAAAGVRTLAVTDHDTLAGYREVVLPCAPPLPAGLAVIAGVEINATARDIPDLPDGELHVVGLGIDPADDAFEALLDAQRGARRRRFERMVARCARSGCRGRQLANLDRVDEEALGRPTIARALVAAGFAADVPDAFARLVGSGKPGYVRREGMSPREALAAIRAAGGLPVLAHFALAPQRAALVRDLIEAGLGGIETHHRSFDAATVTAMEAVATQHRLVPSGGTVCHGDAGSYADAFGESWIPEESTSAVLAALARRPRRLAGMTARELPGPGAPPRDARHGGATRAGHAADGRVASSGRSDGPAPLLGLDPRLPDEPQRLRGDGGTPARRGLRRGGVDGIGRPRRHQHLRHP